MNFGSSRIIEVSGHAIRYDQTDECPFRRLKMQPRTERRRGENRRAVATGAAQLRTDTVGAVQKDTRRFDRIEL